MMELFFAVQRMQKASVQGVWMKILVKRRDPILSKHVPNGCIHTPCESLPQKCLSAYKPLKDTVPHRAMLTVFLKKCGSIWKWSRWFGDGRNLMFWYENDSCCVLCNAVKTSAMFSCPYHSHCLMPHSTIGHSDRTIQLQPLPSDVISTVTTDVNHFVQRMWGKISSSTPSSPYIREKAAHWRLNTVTNNKMPSALHGKSYFCCWIKTCISWNAYRIILMAAFE